MSWLNSIGSFFGGGDSGTGWTNIFGALLSGFGDDEGESAERATREATREAGTQNRLTAAFSNDLDYFREMQRRHETSRALDGSYNQFSTVRNWAPNYVRGPGLDALPTKPKPEDYDGKDDD
jgi:hypothetical protein